MIRYWISGIVVFICGIAAVLYFVAGSKYQYKKDYFEKSGSSTVSESYMNLSAKLFFSDRATGLLIVEERNMRHSDSVHESGRTILRALLIGPEKIGERTLPAEAVLRAFYVLKDGTAVVDFSKEIRTGLPGGAASEYMAVLSVTRSLTENIPVVKRVRFLVEGKEEDTLAGHVSLEEPFSSDTSWDR